MIELSKISDLYNDRVLKFGYSANSVGWSSFEQQEIRFRKLIVGLNLTSSKVIDVGSGFGDFYSYLLRNQIALESYLGIDISNEMIKFSENRYSKLENVSFLEISAMDKKIPSSDFVFASGSLNYNLETDMWEYLTQFVQFYKNRVQKGLIFNLLSTKVDFVEDHHAHYDPEKVKKLVSRYFPKVNIFEGYGLYEFTVQGLK
jgi:ubiquinone/menaquinone biosynthesis C-methylase UbiE